MASFTLDEAINAALDREGDLHEVINRTGVVLREQPAVGAQAVGRRLRGDVLRVMSVQARETARARATARASLLSLR